MGHALRVKSLNDLKCVKDRANKFGARKKVVDGIEFDSTKEAERYQLLKLELKAGAIRELKIHVPIHVSVNDIYCFSYECDFVFQRKTPIGDRVEWVTRYEDCKGWKKGSAYQLFKLKAALVWAVHRINVEEV